MLNLEQSNTFMGYGTIQYSLKSRQQSLMVSPILLITQSHLSVAYSEAVLTKEAFAIYMSVKKLSFYLTDAHILLRSDHKPLEKFLCKNMLNSKVNNLAMELEAFNIKLNYIKGSNNVSVDTMSRLVNINPDTQQHPEGPGYEFGYAVFEEFPEVKTNTYEVNEVIVGTQKEIKSDPDLQDIL